MAGSFGCDPVRWVVGLFGCRVFECSVNVSSSDWGVLPWFPPLGTVSYLKLLSFVQLPTRFHSCMLWVFLLILLTVITPAPSNLSFFSFSFHALSQALNTLLKLTYKITKFF